MSSAGANSHHTSLTRNSHQSAYNYLNGSGSATDTSQALGGNPFSLAKAQHNSLSQQLYKATGESQTRVGSASHQKAQDQQKNIQNTIGVRQSFTQKPPTDMRNQPQMFQKNMKYLESNRLGSAGATEEKFSSTGTTNSSASTKRDHQVYRSMTGGLTSTGNTNSNNSSYNHNQSSSSQVRQQQTQNMNRLLENNKPYQQRTNNNDNSLQLNLPGKSRNQSNSGFNVGNGETSINEKFSSNTISTIPKSTTNKTYTSLTNQMKDAEQLAPSTSRGLPNQLSGPSYLRNSSQTAQPFRGGQQNSSGNALRSSNDYNKTGGPSSSNVYQYSNTTTTPKQQESEKVRNLSQAAATFLSRHQRIEDNSKNRPTSKNGGSSSQQKYPENVSNTQEQSKSQTRSSVRESQQAKDIPNMKFSNARPNTVGYKETNQSNKSATQSNQIKSQTMGSSSLQQLIKEASLKNTEAAATTIQSQRNSQLTSLQQRHKSNSREMTNNINTPALTQTQIPSSRNQSNQAHKSQQQVMTKQNLKSFFEANAGNMNLTQKVDPATGISTKVQSFTTLNINQMIHDADEDDETKKLPLQPGTRIVIPNHEPTKCSMKRNGIVRAYAANTNQGLVRNYNEDRVSIILNIVKPEHRQHEEWPKCSFFGVYDGHGGHACAEFLRDNLHHFVIKEDSFPWNPKEAILKGFQKAEDRFMEMCLGTDDQGMPTLVERSGSCAIVALIVADMCYIANVGDSRAVLSAHLGQQVAPLSQDHKPSDQVEYQRIIAAGGQVYQTTTATSTQQSNGQSQEEETDPDYIVGPIRVLPGRLSVSRTFGDPEAKLAFRGGNPNVVACIPDVESFKITKDHDFIILACDGIFDKMSNDDVSTCVWNSCNIDNKDRKIAHNVHQQSGLAVESILKNSLYRQSLDNVTVVMIAFQNFKRHVFGKSKHSERSMTREGYNESQKENINMNKQQSKSGSIGSFLSQRTNDENIPPQQQQQLKKGVNKPPTSANMQNTMQNNKNMNHLLNAMNGSSNSSQGEALKEKTGMFINRSYNQQQFQNIQNQQQTDQLNRQIGSRKPSIGAGQQQQQQQMEQQNPISFLNQQQNTPKGAGSTANTVYRSLNGSLRNNTMGNGGSLNMRNGNPASIL